MIKSEGEIHKILPIKKLVSSTLKPGVWEINNTPIAMPIDQRAAMAESSL